jgi:hypothetical protein
MTEFSLIYLRGADWQKLPVFTKYFDYDVFPKFILFSGHAETIFPHLQAMFPTYRMEEA